MTSAPIYSSKPDRWTQPRPHCDASTRFQKYGRIQPLYEPSFIERLFGLD
ncbi:hypothetical protein [Erythrobacter sp. KY5]|nr:hypothetical protein [Erythrobacter sp. KY5]